MSAGLRATRTPSCSARVVGLSAVGRIRDGRVHRSSCDKASAEVGPGCPLCRWGLTGGVLRCRSSGSYLLGLQFGCRSEVEGQRGRQSVLVGRLRDDFRFDLGLGVGTGWSLRAMSFAAASRVGVMSPSTSSQSRTWRYPRSSMGSKSSGMAHLEMAEARFSTHISRRESGSRASPRIG